MAVAEGEDGKLHYTNNNKCESYGHWYDEGPGSEKFKREIFREPKWPYFHPFSQEKNYDKESKMLKELEKLRKKEYITDEDLEIDI
jgi:hypothetical protein